MVAVELAARSRDVKLSNLIAHTSDWTGIPQATIASHARYLREKERISSGAHGVAAAEMTRDDKFTLLLSVCGVSVAKAAPAYVDGWLKNGLASTVKENEFQWTKRKSLVDAIEALIAEIQTPSFLSWAGETTQNYIHRHKVFVEFSVDQCRTTIGIERYGVDADGDEGVEKKIEAHYVPINWNNPPKKPIDAGRYRKVSSLIRRLERDNLIGWGQCLNW